MRILAAICLFFALAIPAKADVRDCINATVKVHCQAGQSMSTGTGVVFAVKANYVWVITNCHVVAENPNGVECIFYKWGHRSKLFKAQVAFKVKNNEADIAVLVVPQAEFKGQEPKPIPIAPMGTKVESASCLYTNGCAKGAEPSLIAARTLKDDGVTLEFRPPPMEGRSGSGMFDKEGTQIVGLLYARSVEQNAVGMAVSLDMLHKYVYKKTNTNAEKKDAEVKPHVLLPYMTEIEVKPHVLLPYLEQRDIQLLQWVEDGWLSPGGCGPGGCPSQRQPPRIAPRKPQKPQVPDNGDYGENLGGDLPFPTLPGETKPRVDPEATPIPETQPDAKPQPKKGNQAEDWIKEHKAQLAIGFLVLVVLGFAGATLLREGKKALIEALKKELKQ